MLSSWKLYINVRALDGCRVTTWEHWTLKAMSVGGLSRCWYPLITECPLCHQQTHSCCNGIQCSYSSCNLCNCFCCSSRCTWVSWRDMGPIYIYFCGGLSSSSCIYVQFCAIRYRWRCDSSCLLECLFPSSDRCICTCWIPNLCSGSAVSQIPSRKGSGRVQGAQIKWTAEPTESLGPLE